MMAVDFSAEDTETLVYWSKTLTSCAYVEAINAELRRRGE